MDRLLLLSAAEITSVPTFVQEAAVTALTVDPTPMRDIYAKRREYVCRRLREMGLSRIFWCVSPENERAVRFYDKGGYRRIEAAKVDAQRYYPSQRIDQLLWYCVTSK